MPDEKKNSDSLHTVKRHDDYYCKNSKYWDKTPEQTV